MPCLSYACISSYSLCPNAQLIKSTPYLGFNVQYYCGNISALNMVWCVVELNIKI